MSTFRPRFRLQALPAQPQQPAAVTPLAPARHKVEFSASAERRDKLGQLQVLMCSSHPDGDVAAIIEEGATEKLERLDAKRLRSTTDWSSTPHLSYNLPVL